MSVVYDLIVVGGGAAGFFGAIQAAEANPDLKILILEKSHHVLTKVKISGGGRCNVTHGIFEPKEFVENYPRGKKELLGPFHNFMSGDMLEWLSNNGVETHIEEDGRVFPGSNSSQTIIDCFLNAVNRLGIRLEIRTAVQGLIQENDIWQVQTNTASFSGKNILFATGSSTDMWQKLQELGHAIIQPVPSLFTFKIKHPIIAELQGMSVPVCEIKIVNTNYEHSGPLMITHWGLSGPAVLKLSAWAAIELHSVDYHFEILVNWCNKSFKEVLDEFLFERKYNGKRKVLSFNEFSIPKRLWLSIVSFLNLEDKNLADINAKQLEELVQALCACRFEVNGTTKFKDEFVTAGGVDTREVNFKTMESKLHRGLYFAGEVLNIDGITGGFNFQAAWSGAWLAAQAIAKN